MIYSKSHKDNYLDKTHIRKHFSVKENVNFLTIRNILLMKNPKGIYSGLLKGFYNQKKQYQLIAYLTPAQLKKNYGKKIATYILIYKKSSIANVRISKKS